MIPYVTSMFKNHYCTFTYPMIIYSVSWVTFGNYRKNINVIYCAFILYQACRGCLERCRAVLNGTFCGVGDLRQEEWGSKSAKFIATYFMDGPKIAVDNTAMNDDEIWV